MEDANIETIINIILLLPLVIYGWYLILKDDKKGNCSIEEQRKLEEEKDRRKKISLQS